MTTRMKNDRLKDTVISALMVIFVYLLLIVAALFNN